MTVLTFIFFVAFKSICTRLYRCSIFHLCWKGKYWPVYYMKNWRPGKLIVSWCFEAGYDFPSVSNTMTSLQCLLSWWLAMGADLIRKEWQALNRECQFTKLSEYSCSFSEIMHSSNHVTFPLELKRGYFDFCFWQSFLVTEWVCIKLEYYQVALLSYAQLLDRGKW